MTNPQTTPPPAETSEPAAPYAPPPAQPLSARGWLAQNGPWIVFLGAAFAWGYVTFGLQTVLAFLLALFGLGFVIFIHELGHFLAAKWCDVHVLTFSIGFGPALPGCSFTRGETTYKLGILPLGGYVNMVGEGPEADEEEDYPRSFKNKSVGARMLIISAGVIMNVLFGAACFIAVYRYFGVPEETSIIWTVEPGARAWNAGVHSGWKVVRLNGKDNPTFLEMRRAVALSSANKPLEFVFEDRQGNRHEMNIEPYRDENGLVPVIGVAAARQLQLLPERYRREIGAPVRVKSPASIARVLNLNKGDVVLQASDPEHPDKLTPLPSGEKGWLELAQRFEKAGEATLTLEVARGGDSGKAEKVQVPAVGFDFGDRVVGTTEPATPDQPYNLSEIPLDREHASDKDLHDPFVFRKRMTALEGKPIVIQVRRAGASATAEPTSVFVPPAYHVTLGMTMKMGKVAAIRPGSPAAGQGVDLKAGSADGDVITGVKLRYENEPEVALGQESIDPVRLPWELERHIRTSGKDPAKWRVILTVKGPHNHDMQKERTLPPLRWDDSYALAEESAVSAGAPMSIPQLGIAYWVESTVVSVKPGSPAELAGVKPNDIVTAFKYRAAVPPGARVRGDGWSDWSPMASERGKEKEVYDQWAQFFNWMQIEDAPKIKLRVKRDDGSGKPELLDLPVSDDKNAAMESVVDPSWPAANRGLRFERDTRLKKANSLWQAVEMGLDETLSTIRVNYQSMSGLASGRISTKTMGGPIEIMYQSISAAGDNLWMFAQLLGIISIGLAVVNFLPIPVLDGGHMVFLIYEKLRGKPPSETVRVVATYIGLAIILLLMLFVFRLDFVRRILPGLKSWFGG